MKLKSRCGIVQVTNISQGICTAQGFMNNVQGLRHNFFLFAKINPIYLWPRSLTTYAVGQRLIKLHQSLYNPLNSDLGILEISPHHHSILWSQSLAGSGRTWLRGTAKPEPKLTRNPFIP